VNERQRMYPSFLKGVVPLLIMGLMLAACGGGSGGADRSTPSDSIGGTHSPSPGPTPTPDPQEPSPDPEQPPEEAPEEPAPAPDPLPETPTLPKSVKRGIAYDLQDPRDLAALAPGVSWWYRWALEPASTVPADYRTRYGMDFIPMLWGDFNDAQAEAFLRANPHIKYLLLMNEPNLTDQANMSPQQAAQLWPRYEAIAAKTGVQLVGPAMTWGTMEKLEDPVVWLDAFYDEYRKANGGRDPRIDYLAFHWYDYGLAGQLDRLTKYGKSFWVTEFANWHGGNDGAQIDSVAKQKAQMTEMVAVCESRSDVFRYAWFTGRRPDEASRHTSLLGAAGELTELGRHYLAQPYWVGTWIDPADAGQVSQATFDKQTLRQVVKTSVAGKKVRILLSNKHGADCVTLSNVHIALRGDDASIDPATDRTITFGGKATVTLPAGAQKYSDPVAFSVAAQADVAISFYLPHPAAVAINRSRSSTQQLTYVAAGDESGSADFPVVERSDALHLIASLEVQGESLRGSAATIGGPIAAGVGLDDARQSWPNLLAKRLDDESILVSVLNRNGAAVASGASAKGQRLVDLFRQPNLRWLIHSDVAFDELRGMSSYDQLIASLQETAEQARLQQVKLLCTTLTPYKGHPSWTADAERVRRMYNARIRRAGSGCDAVIDFDRVLRDPSRPTRLLPMYDSGDHLHPNVAGHRAIANAIDLNVLLTPIAYSASEPLPALPRTR
jgi:lysophospholipase L1-like esterase